MQLYVKPSKYNWYEYPSMDFIYFKAKVFFHARAQLRFEYLWTCSKDIKTMI